MSENLQPATSTPNNSNQTPKINLATLGRAKNPRDARSTFKAITHNTLMERELETSGGVVVVSPAASGPGPIVEPKPIDHVTQMAQPSAAGTTTNSSLLAVDTTRMQLISPPPEEVLRRGHQRQQLPFTPSLLVREEVGGDDETPKGGTTKRKREKHATPKPQRTNNTAVPSSTVAPIPSESQSQWEATPNPKPRKQVRRQREEQDSSEQDQDQSREDEDVEMDSPTKARFHSARDVDMIEPLTPTNKSIHSVRTDKAKAKPIILQSPHKRNPDADYIPPTSLVAEQDGEDEEDGIGDLNTVGSAVKRRLFAAKSSRRSATPIPPYEPPKDVFTPPREVYVSPPPPPSRRTSRKSSVEPIGKTKKRQSKAANLTPVVVKQEMPDIDLTTPMPPPSPTDDPLLLSSDIEIVDYIPAASHRTPQRKKKGTKERSTIGKKKTPASRRKSKGKTFELETTSTAEAAEVVLMEESGLVPAIIPDDLPPSSPPADSDDDGGYYDWTKTHTIPMESTEEDSMMQIDSEDARVAPVPLLDFDAALREQANADAAGGGDWSDTDDEQERDEDAIEGQGEYTGRWRLLKVRTKTDPPSSATSKRMEMWGRPVSPFPDIERLNWGPDKVREEEQEVGKDELPVAEEEQDTNPEHDVPIVEEPPQQEGNDSEEEEEVMRMSMEPEEEADGNEQNVDRSVEHRYEVDDANEEGPSSQARSDELPSNEQERSSSVPLPSPNRHEESFYDTVVPILPEESEVSEHPLSLDDQTPEVASNADNDGDDEDLSEFEDLGVVKIISADPRAAARAAAILKQHDYECFTKGALKRRHSSIDQFAQDSRRRSLLSAGIQKDRKRRRSMGVVGDRVIIPGSPATTLPELLEQAEKQVLESPARRLSTPGRASLPHQPRDPFVTPVPVRTLFPSVAAPTSGPRSWTKEEWKLLDSCFTDERLDLAEQDPSYTGMDMAPVDAVSLDNVVSRFIQVMGGEQVVREYGEAWERESLTQRVRALQKKQRGGNVAPPSTPRSPSAETAIGGRNRRPSMEAPDFTPLGRRALPPRKPRPSLPNPVSEDTPFSNLPPANNRPSRLPASLLAPRYSHLLDEAMTISNEVATLADKIEAFDPSPESPPPPAASDVSISPVAETSLDDISMASHDVSNVSMTVQPQPLRTPSLGKRLKGVLFSYLPILSKTAPAASRKQRLPAQPGLPLPPLDILEKPRAPVVTPARLAPPKVPHPKELVELHPAPSKPSMIPRPKQPQRLVELHPVTPQPESAPVPRPRRSSGGSVKDLIKSFEQLKETELTRPLSSLSTRPRSQASKLLKPAWRP